MTPNVFRELARQGPQDAPPSVELTLRVEFRKRKRKRTLIRWTVAIAAVFLAIAFVPWPKPVSGPDPRLAHIAVPDLPPVAQPVREVGVSRRRVRKPRAAPVEVATRFYPLQDASTLSPFEYGTLVRVQLPRSALRAVGLPVNEDRISERISADVLLGQDGLARAVRFVQ
jgi:hypothetical protein